MAALAGFFVGVKLNIYVADFRAVVLACDTVSGAATSGWDLTRLNKLNKAPI